MKIALIKNGFVENVIVAADLAFTQTLGYDKALEVLPANRVANGWNISGVLYPDKAEAPEVANERTLRQQAENVLASNLQDITDADAWLNGAGAGTGTLTAAQLSPAVRQIMRALRASKKAENGAIRILLGRFDATT